MAVFRRDIFKAEALHGRCAVIHRIRFSRLHKLGSSVRVAEIEGIRSKRRHDLLHHKIPEDNIVQNRILAASPARLDTQTAVGMVKPAFLHDQIIDAARHLTADGDRAVSMLHQALIDVNIGGWRLVSSSHVDLSGFHCDTVIPEGEAHTADRHIAAGFRIKTVRIR